MLFPAALLRCLTAILVLLSYHGVFCRAARGIPDPSELVEYLENSHISDLDIIIESSNSTFDKRVSLSCFATLCCFGRKPGGSSTQMAWICPDDWPSLADLKSKIVDYGNVGNKISFFYSGLGGRSAVQQAKTWACSHTQYVPASPGFVAWDTIVDDAWYLAQSAALGRIFGLNNLDPFQKLLSQAFAEVTKGDVYVFTPTGYNVNDPFPGAQTTIAWVGWEYPALTRNADVSAIYRVDPRSGQDQDRYQLWIPADGPSPQAPLGLYNAPSPPAQP